MPQGDSSVILRIVQPRGGARFELGSPPAETQPVSLRALLFEGEDDVSSSASITWTLSWQGTYRTYSREIADGPAPTVRFETGGGLLRAVAVYRGRRHRDSIRVHILGTNPSREQIAAAVGADDALRAICWRESRWRQFDSRGAPLKSKNSSARGIAQIMESSWEASPFIAHNDYLRVAWQWDYGIETARDILDYLMSRARKARAAEDDAMILNRTIKAYKAGARSLKTLADPKEYPYVKEIRRLMADKPWEA